MEYTNILKQALAATKRTKIMWLLGLFVAGSSSGCNVNIPGNIGSGTNYEQLWNNDVNSEFNYALDYITSNLWWMLIILGLLVIALIIVRVVLHNIAVGGMFRGAQLARTNQTLKFGELFKFGLANFWKVLGLHIVIKGSIVLGAMIIAVPLILLGITIVGLIVVIPAVIVLVILLIPFGIAVQIILMQARQFLVFQQQGIIESIKSAWQLLKTRLSDNVLCYLMTLLAGLVVGLATILGILIIIIPTAILGFITYSASAWAVMIIIGILAALILMVLLLAIKGVYQTFMFHFWHIAFAELTQSEKTSTIVAA
ncbi:MAG: hypothetical protein WCW27_03180 [Patescibacteria group bacterium]|jgi:hypothetical protein